MKKAALHFGLLLWLWILMQGVAAFAQSPAAGAVLTLEQALRVAYQRNPDMIEARKEIDAAKGRRIQAESLPNPSMEWNIGGLKKTTRNQKEVYNGNLDSFSVSQPFDPPGTRMLGALIARDEVKISQSTLDLVWADVRKKIIGLYASILSLQKTEEIAHENLSTTQQFFARVQTRYQGGTALRSDVLRSKIEVSRAENDTLVVQKDLKVACGQFNLALGYPLESEVTLSDSLEYEALHYRYAQIKDAAIAARSDIKIERTRLSSKKKTVWREILKTIFPQFEVGLVRTTQSFNNDTGVNLKMSYPLWGLNWGEVKEAKAMKEKQEVHLDTLKKRIGLEVYAAFLEVELSDKQVLIQKSSLEEANELLKQVTIKYEEGETPFLTFLENIKTIKETRVAYYESLKNYKEKVAELEQVIQAAPVPKV